MSTYAVCCELGLENYDRPRVGYAAARAAFAEVRQLGRSDRRVRSTRFGRPDRLTARISITLVASSPWEAFDLARAILRTAVHSNGGSTAGWELLRPDVRHGPGTSFPSWAECAVAARARSMPHESLPPLRASSSELGGAPQLIDLR